MSTKDLLIVLVGTPIILAVYSGYIEKSTGTVDLGTQGTYYCYNVERSVKLDGDPVAHHKFDYGQFIVHPYSSYKIEIKYFWDGTKIGTQFYTYDATEGAQIYTYRTVGDTITASVVKREHMTDPTTNKDWIRINTNSLVFNKKTGEFQNEIQSESADTTGKIKPDDKHTQTFTGTCRR